MVILGIDPGSRATGFGIIRIDEGKTVVVEYGCIGLKGDALHGDRLRNIYEKVSGIIDRHNPDAFAIEMPIYARNAQSMLKLGRAQASAMLAALNRGIAVDQYTPKEIKKAVTGNGNAAKEQVAYMVSKVLALPSSTATPTFDALDALAVAMCRAHRSNSTVPVKSRGWDAFVRANPDRLIQ